MDKKISRSPSRGPTTYLQANSHWHEYFLRINKVHIKCIIVNITATTADFM